MKYLTDKTIFVCGMNRTGQHAISTWIMSAHDNAVYKNNIGFSCKKGEQVPTVPVFRLNDSLKSTTFHYRLFKDGEFSETGMKLLSPEYQSQRDIILYGIEMASPEVFANGYRSHFFKKQQKFIESLQEQHTGYNGLQRIGKTNTIVFVLRSPWNHYASGYFWRRGDHAIKKPEIFSTLWIKYAEEFLGITNFVGDQFVPVLYDKWFTDKDYRESLANKMEIPFTDEGRDIVLGYGKGSTFQKHKSGTQLNPLDRWQKCLKNSESKKALKDMLLYDDRLIDYATRLFGELPFNVEDL
jgi:hypothetical protein